MSLCVLKYYRLLPFKGKIRLLDVGSCYDPFKELADFLAVGIDICPAAPVVLSLCVSCCYRLVVNILCKLPVVFLYYVIVSLHELYYAIPI